MFQLRRVGQFKQHVSFIANPDFQKSFASKTLNDQASLSLSDISNEFNILEYIPKNFIITTYNNSYNFNIDLLKDTSQIISNILKQDPNFGQFFLELNDETNILKKVEELYQGKNVIFQKDELAIFYQITQRLNITCFSKYFQKFLFTDNQNNILNHNLEDGIGVSKEDLYKFFKNEQFQWFTIVVNDKEYKVNAYGVYFSNVIREFLLNNPKSNRFVIETNEGFDGIHLIIDLFNFDTVKITGDNMHSLKEIAEYLQINFVIEKVDNFIENYEKFAKTIDDQQSISDSIEEIFHLLYHIKENSIETTVTTILDSIWVKTEEDVQELAAFLLQVIKTDLSLHSNLIELMIELDKVGNSDNNLKILIPLVTNKLMKNFGKEKQACSFIYKLYKKGFIETNVLNENINKVFDDTTNSNYVYSWGNDRMNILRNIYSWFLPEIIDLNLFNRNHVPIGSSYSYSFGFHTSNQSDSNKFHDWRSFVNFFYPDKIDIYKKMRDSDEPNEDLTNALRHDDVDTLQSIISKGKIDLRQSTVPYNIFESFVTNGDTKYINYAAAYGSIKCFKYLLLNHALIDDSTFRLALFGGNIEIIKIVDQKLKKIRVVDIDSPIMMHRNDLFDWIMDQKITKIDESMPLVTYILNTSAACSNSHAFIETIEKHTDISNLYMKLIQDACENGFYRMARLIWNICHKDNSPPKSDSLKLKYNKNDKEEILSFVTFGNLSIFKLFLDINFGLNEIEKCLAYLIQNNEIKIIKYFFENFSSYKVEITNSFVYNLLQKSLDNEKDDLFVYLFDQFKRICPTIYEKFLGVFDLITTACKNGSFEAFKLMINIVSDDSHIDLTEDFYYAAISNSYEICKYIIDHHLFINFIQLSERAELSSIKTSIFSLMFETSSSETKELFLTPFLGFAIKKNNFELVEYLLEKNAKLKSDDLINAVKINNFEMVQKILQYNKKPSFINKRNIEGTAIFLAAQNENIQIVNLLLSIPGINPDLYSKSERTPLIKAIENHNIEIVEAFINFYGDKIESQLQHFKDALNYLLKMISKSYDYSVDKNLEVKNLFIRRFLSIKSIDPNVYTDKYTLLSYACEINQIELVKMLLDNEKIDVNLYASGNGNTPLIHSLLAKNTEIAKLLIEDKRTNINVHNYHDQTALTIAVNHEMIDIVELLIKNENFDAEESLLDYAFFIADSEISKLLISIEELDVNYQHFDDEEDNKRNFETSLTLSIINKDYEKIDLIIHHHSFDHIKSQLLNGILISIRRNDAKAFNKLLALVNNDVNINIETPQDFCLSAHNSLFDLALENLSQDVVVEIINNPTFDLNKNNIVEGFIRVCSPWSNSPPIGIMETLVDFDSKHNHSIDFNKLLDSGKSFFTAINISDHIKCVVDFLITHGVDPNMPDFHGIYPLQYAIKEESVTFVQQLLDTNKIDYNQKIFNPDLNYSQTYIHLAAKAAHSDILSAFIVRKAMDINSVDDIGDTPLIVACRFGQFTNIRLLFQIDDLDYKHVNNEGDDALKIAQFHSTETINASPDNKEDYLRLLLHFLNHVSNELDEEESGNNIDFEEDEEDFIIDEYSYYSDEDDY